MPYKRTDYTLTDIKIAFTSIHTHTVQGNQIAPDGVLRPGAAFGKGNFGIQPAPHAHIHAGDELRNHPLFAMARVSTGDANTHSVMDETTMATALVSAFNSAGMQPFLEQLDNGTDAVQVHVNFNATPGTCRVYSATNTRQQNANAVPQAVIAFFLKLRRNPNNGQIPIIQTAVPHTTALQIKTKKGKLLGCTV
ncbi:MAG: hypothetical protein EA400_08610 [Chromatiaceae bacterium]|nr:MAG: hypothetical protein EA400_08610 [Chromatiaceae bacterium]